MPAPVNNALSLDARLLDLEAKLGVGLPIVTKSDIARRLDKVQAAVNTQTTSGFRETWHESQALFKELDPGMALTHQQQPLLYRRQEVLAAATSLDKDMQELSKIMHLLQPQTEKGKTLREDQVTQAPILTQYYQISPSDEQRLDQLRLTMDDLAKRLQLVMVRTDAMLESYHTIMAVASEKVVMADETIKAKER
mmetsp:Transcript_32918/g.79635  ORF Transcript_32918/g.79635 Transcript_32918/m.79635 type:complete len:195 (-) Transcript_32918:49-633(-)|eukprot:CAMPEP_0113625606 /NCGR_PEP_ID=MMETSP0017_2-20120614/13229_1 /TAXON_ID=2856 /ORGANISM="Cylindrotheca closterium" /LENGTH=194 /DNA_ID=CAMNT_0000535731 /DNA_START=124 /DNA_END=708 /DNA_ORIENTATION=+ /assembly_acc=CAM_ASM_000147